jgi:hypothetical protein
MRTNVRYFNIEKIFVKFFNKQTNCLFLNKKLPNSNKFLAQ